MTQLIGSAEVALCIVDALGFDTSETKLSDSTSLAALLRRAASFLAPCSPRQLRERVMLGLTKLDQDAQITIERVDEIIEELVSYGDLLELPSRSGEGNAILLYLAQPSFLVRQSGKIFLFGIPPGSNELLPTDIRTRVQYQGATRSLVADPSEDLMAILTSFGMQEMTERLWMRRPRSESPSNLIARYDLSLGAAANAGEVTDIQVLDAELPVDYYRSRWVSPGRLTGRFIARRPQKFGAALWAYVELDQGHPVRLVDIAPAEWRACDYAWQLQLAIDFERGFPQQFRASNQVNDSVEVAFHSPLPQWFRKRLNIVGKSLDRVGVLFAYHFSKNEFEVERELLVSDAWLRQQA